MRYILLADEVARGITEVLDAASHPEETKERVHQIKQSIESAIHVMTGNPFTEADVKTNLNQQGTQ